MSDQVVPRDSLGRILPGHSLNPLGPPPKDRPRFNRDAIIERCVKEDYEPIRELIKLSRHPDASPYLQFAVHKEISEYLYPKRKSIVLGDENGEGAEIRISWDQPQDGNNVAHTDVPVAHTDVPKVRKRRDEQTKEFDRKMRNATATVMDAVLMDDNDSQT